MFKNVHAVGSDYPYCRACLPDGPISCSKLRCPGFIHRELRDPNNEQSVEEVCDVCSNVWGEHLERAALESQWDKAKLPVHVDDFEPEP